MASNNVDQNNSSNSVSNSDYIVENILEMLVSKNPLFEADREQYRDKIKINYEKSLYTGLMAELSKEKYEEFYNMLVEEPDEKEKHDNYLKDNVPDFENKVILLSEEFITKYSNYINNM